MILDLARLTLAEEILGPDLGRRMMAAEDSGNPLVVTRAEFSMLNDALDKEPAKTPLVLRRQVRVVVEDDPFPQAARGAPFDTKPMTEEETAAFERYLLRKREQGSS